MEPDNPLEQTDTSISDKDEDEDQKSTHEFFMRAALQEAEYALAHDETPVGCVLVHDGTIIARGANATNATLNGTRHAEFMAIASLQAQLRSHRPSGAADPAPEDWRTQTPAEVLRRSDLYVTIEPCVMCASLLRQYRIRKVYFGAGNERFGGAGGVLSIHEAGAALGEGYPVSGGWLRGEAILLLRRFYVGQNERAPEPRSKKDRKLNLEIEPLAKLDDGSSGAAG